MGLRCSILGHTFDETEVRRDRRERGSGNEVITVVKQVERCSRCGAERVVSENKEVVSVVDAEAVGVEESPDEAAPEPDAGADGRADAESAVPDEREEASADAADPLAEGRPDDAPDVPAGPSDAETDDVEPPADPSEEDVEFITETEGSLGGGEDVADDEEVGDVTAEGSGGIGGMAARSGAFDGADDGPPETDEDDAEILDAPETDRAPGQWPDDPDGTTGPWEPEPLDETDPAGTDAADAPEATDATEPDVEPTADPSFTVPDGSLRCPACGHAVSADSSFRAGDACPECRAGYLEAADE